VATNLRSYFTPSDPNHVDEHPNNDQDHQLHRQRCAYAHEHHSHWGSRWAESKATCRFRTQSAQFDTGTSSSQKRTRPLASQLILVINNECCTAQIRNNWSKLAVSAFRSHNTSRQPRLRSHNKLGIFCVYKDMDRPPMKNQITVFKSLWKILIVWGSSRMAPRSIV
jgi:hypothetical protein